MITLMRRNVHVDAYDNWINYVTTGGGMNGMYVNDIGVSMSCLS